MKKTIFILTSTFIFLMSMSLYAFFTGFGSAHSIKQTIDKAVRAGVISASTNTNSNNPPVAIPVAPSTPTAVAGYSYNTISWPAVSGATSYNIYWSTAAGLSTSSGAVIQNIQGVTSPYTHAGLTNGVTYYYAVTAANSAGESGQSVIVSAAPMVLAAPVLISVTSGYQYTTLTWSNVTGALSYKVYWSTSAGVTKSTGAVITGSTSPYIHAGLTNGVTYYYGVTSVNGPGESILSNVLKGIPAKQAAPLPPTGLSCVPGDSQLQITWNSSTGAVTYNLYWSTSSSITKTNSTKMTNVTSTYTLTTLTNGMLYYVAMTAVNAYGESSLSAVISGIPVWPVPAAPANVVFTPDNDQAWITWNNSTGAASYNLYWGTSMNITKTNSTKVTNVTNPYLLINLINGNQYYVGVTAVNTSGESELSAIISGMPLYMSWNQAYSAGWGPSPVNGYFGLIGLTHNVVAYNNKMYIIAGSDGGSSLNNYTPFGEPCVWSSSSGFSWNRETNSAPFGNRYGNACVAYNGKMWTFGGRTDHNDINSMKNDVYSSTSGATWSLVKADNTSGYPKKYGAAAVVFSSAMYILGGKTIDGSYTNDVWRSSDGITWVQLRSTSTLNGFDPRWFFGCVDFNNGSGDKLWVIGGSSGSINYGDIWNSSDGVTWTLVTASAPFNSRYEPGLTVFNGKMWLIGGASGSDYSSATFYNDVWNTSNGTTWTQADSNANFEGRTSHGCVTFNNKIWILGGDDSNWDFLGQQLRDAWYYP